MQRSTFPAFYVAILFLFVSASASEPLPNIVLIVADDMGFADAGCYGASDIRTPNLDRLAREGTRFTNFNVAQSVCTASRAALLSGCYPNRIGMAGALNHTSLTGIHSSETLLSELAKSAGYATACYGKWHLGARAPFDPNRHGFDDWFGLPYSNDNGPLHPTVRGIPPLPLIENGKIVALDPDQSTFTKIFTERATKFIADNQSKPFFLYLPHVMPHVPIAASKAFLGKSARGLYGDVIEELDWSVGEILDALQKSQVDQNTLVVFLSDNGPFLSYGNHAGSAGSLREGKLTTFEGGVRVPLLLRWPNHVPQARVCDELIAGIDLMPTLAKWMCAPKPMAKIDGQDLSSVLLGQLDAQGRKRFAYYSGSELHAVREGKWKLHLPHEYISVNGPPGADGKPANYEKMSPTAIEESGIRGIASRHGYKVQSLELSLFDLSQDVGERINVAAQNPAVVAELSGYAEDIRKELGDTIAGRTGVGIRPVGNDPIDSKPCPTMLFRRENLMAWCIVPFDAGKRTPRQRATMLREMGIHKFAYDYRAEHIPSFELEIMALRDNGIELSAWWFPSVLNEEAKSILAILKKHDAHPQLWVMGGGDAKWTGAESSSFAASEAERIRSIAVAAGEIGCKVGLYNHGGWFGIPENQIEVLRRVDLPNVGIVFNLHHAHDQLDRLPEVLQRLKPFLLAVNVNGMQTDGERVGKKILPIGQGDRDLEVLATIARSGYSGPIGILNHTDEDARSRLMLNLSGLESMVSKLEALKTNN